MQEEKKEEEDVRLKGGRAGRRKSKCLQQLHTRGRGRGKGGGGGCKALEKRWKSKEKEEQHVV